MKQYTTLDILGVITEDDLSKSNSNGSTVTCEYAVQHNAARGPSCLVGTIVHRLDPDLFSIIADVSGTWGTNPYGETENQSARLRLAQRFFTEDANELLRSAQLVADNFKPWGEALERAGVEVQRPQEFSLSINGISAEVAA